MFFPRGGRERGKNGERERKGERETITRTAKKKLAVESNEREAPTNPVHFFIFYFYFSTARTPFFTFFSRKREGKKNLLAHARP